MKRLRALGLVCCVLAVSGVANAAFSDVDVLGNGSLTLSGWTSGVTTWPTDRNINFTWADALADDPLGGAETTDTDGFEMTWNINSLNPSGPFTTITANFTVNEDLQTVNPDDWASSLITLRLQMDNTGFFHEVVISNLVEDGDDLLASTPVSLSITPQKVNLGVLRLTVVVEAAALTADPPPDPEPDPVIPAPGAVVLGSLGVGLVRWLRRRGTL